MIATSPALDRLLARRIGRDTAPIPLNLSRNDLPALCKELGYTNGAEIGVWKGAYSEKFCEAHPAMHMLCVDPWVSYPAWLDSKNKLPQADGQRIMNEAYAQAFDRLSKKNCTIVRQFSDHAASRIADRSLDFAYIDGNHVYDAVLQDLTLWATKVKPGGLLCGHDYRAFTNKPTIHVIDAVQTYTKAHGIDPWFITSADRTPSWLWVVH